MAQTIQPRRLAPAVPEDTLGGLSLEPSYGPDDVADLDVERDLGVPGEFPYTRGIHDSMYRGKLWTMRQFAGFGSAADTNERYRFLLDHGQTGLSVAFDMPTLMGHDSDAPQSLGEVGRCGVAIDSVEDMRTLFDGIDLGRVTTSMTINSPAPIVFAQYLVVAEEQGVPIERLGGTLQNDILKEYIAQKEFIFPVQPSMRLVTDVVTFCAEKVPRWHPISVSGYHIREAGSTAAQELAFTLADGFAYVESAIAAGLDVDDFAPRLSFFFNSHIDFFEEIAKYRAARRIWARRLRERYGASNPKSLQLKFHTQTAGCSLTAQQIENNIARTAFEAMAAVLGGTQSLHTNSMDEVLALPTEKAAQIALRTQQILAYETGVPSVADPLAGSWFIEDLTNRMEAAVEEYFTAIEERGGILSAIAEGYPQREIAEAAFHYQSQLDSGERVIVGVNAFTEVAGGQSPEVLVIDVEVEREQAERLAQLREGRDNTSVATRLDALKEVAAGTENTMPAIIDAVRARATEGEIVAALREVFGVYHETPVF
ncbi:MAG: methylmalonyl-CoA mutase [Candidatus Dormibacteraeota bacterium]|uniref:Methylmalonyl-CoA mutase n=1 Tax=Candidatus Aeolococcus gillhamiae TaxID=3127015 RepID=A0A2W5ZFN9_9BACT|nr:methylmalonyl-CoA mutase [Candidatus Dormibacteraeota bacterium]PZR82747.1 MAG: methylmalonyl-CoA mutase [Candidatus Dormibacter sp. RRmetagenome_bin12]